MLFQQNQKIEIVVRAETTGADTQGANTVTPEENNGNGQRRGGVWATLTGSTSVARQHRVIKTNLTHLFAVTKQTTGLVINYMLGGIGYQNGDAALQDSIERRVEQIQDKTSLVSSFGMGALYGSWGGPIGAVAGATLNTLSTAASILTKYATRTREYNIKVFKQESGIAYQRARASINMTTGRLR